MDLGTEASTRYKQCMVGVIALACLLCCDFANAANHRTRNFIIQAPSPQLARAVGEAAEKYRVELAEYWLGKEIPSWRNPCPIRVITGPRVAAQGVTTYSLNPVRDFQMQVEGTPQRILDSVLPHEVTHTIMATHFGKPLPRWADEGICTTVEHAAERSKHEAKLREFLQTRRGIAMNQLFLLTEYPNNPLPMYAQGYSVCRFLVEQRGPRAFIDFLTDYMRERSWTANVRKHYGYDSLSELQKYWLAWVKEGSGPTDRFVKARSGGNSVRLAAANQNLPSNKRVVGGALDTAVEQGWYSRKRDEVLGKRKTPGTGFDRARIAAESSASTFSHAIPPSVQDSGRYSVSQPQPEGQISRGGVPLYDGNQPPPSKGYIGLR